MSEPSTATVINADLITVASCHQAMLRALTECVLDPWSPDKLHRAQEAQRTLRPDHAAALDRVQTALGERSGREAA